MHFLEPRLAVSQRGSWSQRKVEKGRDMFFVPSYSRMTILPESEATTCNFSDQKNAHKMQ